MKMLAFYPDYYAPNANLVDKDLDLVDECNLLRYSLRTTIVKKIDRVMTLEMDKLCSGSPYKILPGYAAK